MSAATLAERDRRTEAPCPPPALRVLHLSSLYPPYIMGGAERVVEMLAQTMAARGVTTAVAHLVPRPEPCRQQHGVQIYPLRHRNPLWIERSAGYPGPVRQLNKIATLFNFLSTRDLTGVLEEFRPDIVHTHSMVELPPWMWRAAKARGSRIVHTLHDFDLLCIRAALFKDGRRCEVRHNACAAFSVVKGMLHHHVDHVVGVSRSILQTHLEQGFFRNVPEQNRHVIWNPVRVQPRAAGAAAARRTGPFTFGFLGRLVPEKGIDLLLHACRDLPRGGWQLKVAGRERPDAGTLKQQAAGLPIEFVGFVDDPGTFLQSIDVLIVPSIWSEPFGLTVVEAYAAGVPVLGADSGGIAEIIGSVDPRWLVGCSDGTALRERMRALIALGRSESSAPLDFSQVLRRTDPEHVTGQYLEIYRAASVEPAPVH